jgi:hypothetical protein
MSENKDKARIAELEARIKRMEDQLNPPPRPPQPREYETPFPASTYRYIDQMSVPKNVFDKLVETVPTELVRQVVEDRKRDAKQ